MAKRFCNNYSYSIEKTPGLVQGYGISKHFQGSQSYSCTCVHMYCVHRAFFKFQGFQLFFSRILLQRIGDINIQLFKMKPGTLALFYIAKWYIMFICCRRMFPSLRISFSDLDPKANYHVFFDITPVDNKRYRYAYHRSAWLVAGRADPPIPRRYVIHPG